MEPKSLITLFWEEMGILLVLVVPIVMTVIALLGHSIGHFNENRSHHPRHP